MTFIVKLFCKCKYYSVNDFHILKTSKTSCKYYSVNDFPSKTSCKYYSVNDFHILKTLVKQAVNIIL